MPHMFPRSLEASNVDVGSLRKFYRSDSVAPKVLDILAARSSDSRITTVSSIAARLKGAAFAISRAQIIHVFRALETFNCGVFIREDFIRSR
jgi:NAD(P)-dependent dehydrogenase (short-subunit alcohol dehydrogenase family)